MFIFSYDFRMKKTLITFFTVLFCLTSSVSWSLKLYELVERDGIYYKKFSDIPFTGKIESRKIGTGNYKNGKRDGSWIGYYDNGQLMYKGNWKNGKREGSWISYWNSGKLKDKGIYKNNIKISD